MKVRLASTEIGLGRYVGLWTAWVVVFAFQGYLRDSLTNVTWSMFDYLRWSMIQWYTWAALAPAVFRLSARHPLQGRLDLRALGVPLATSFGMTLFALVAGALVSTLFEPSSFAVQWDSFVSQHFASGILTFWGLFAIQQLLRFHDEKTRRDLESSRLSAELAQTRLQALRSQLQPHFLFNTLHAIATLLKDDALSAEDMLLRLSDLLRAFLDDHEGQEVTLRRELVLLDLYLGIQQVRFKDRLTTRIHIDPETLECAVPGLILQPIVENAIQHGIGKRVGPDCVEIESRREGPDLCIDVRNRNSTLSADATDSVASGHGVGLTNTRLRLRELYGDAGSLRLDMVWPEGVACRIRLPYRIVTDADDAPEIVA